MITYAFDLYPRLNPVNGARVLRFSELQQAEYRGEANGTGSGRIVIRGTSTDGTSIDPAGMQYIRVVRINDAVVDGATLSGFSEAVVGGFFLENGDYEALTERSTKKLTFGGAGALSYLGRAVAAEQTYIAGAEGPFDGLWHWYFSPAGGILHRMVFEALDVDRPQSPITGVTLNFFEDLDSDGNPWPGYGTSWLFTAQVGENLLSITRRLMEAGVYVFMDPDTFALSAWMASAHGRARTGVAWGTNVVRFQAPTDGTIATGNIKSDAKRGIGALIKRSDLLVGSAEGYEWVNDPAADLVWEGGYQVDDPTGTSLLQIGAAQLAARSDAGDTVRLRMFIGTSPTTGAYLPFETAGILLDDRVTLHTGTGQWDWNETEQKVAAISLKLRDAGDWDAWVDLGSQYSSIEQRQFANAPVGAHTHPPNPRLCGPGTGTNILIGVTSGSIKVSGENPAAPRTAANDGNDATTWSEGVSDPAIGVAEAYWAADLGALKQASQYRINQLIGGTPTIQNMATEVRLYGSSDAAAWSWLPSGKIAADPAANGWTLLATYTGPLDFYDTGRVEFSNGVYRYWLFRAVTGGTADWDVDELELWNAASCPEPVGLTCNVGDGTCAARDDHVHAHRYLVGPGPHHDADAIVYDPTASGLAATDVQAAIDEVASGASLPWFIVTDYGATGDGTTDDTAAINSAIAAYNAAGGGVLYFPATSASYLVSAGLTALTAPGIVTGDSMGASTITCSSATAYLFTSGSDTIGVQFRDLTLANSATATAGAAIRTTGTGNMARYHNLRITSFWDGVRTEAGAAWVMSHLSMNLIKQYGIFISNAADPDAGVWCIDNCTIPNSANDGDAAIRIESSGGGKITNFESSGGFVHGIDLALPAGGIDTVILLVSNSSIENVTGDGIHITQAGTSTWKHIIIDGCQFGLWNSNTGKAISIVGATAGALSEIAISNNVMHTGGTPRSAIQLTNVDNVSLVGNVLSGFNDLYTATTSTNIVEITPGVTDHGALTGLADDDHTQYQKESEKAAASGYASLDSGTKVPTAQLGTGTADATTFLRGDRTWAASSGGIGEILIVDTGASTPLIFADLIQNEAQNDLVYADV